MTYVKHKVPCYVMSWKSTLSCVQIFSLVITLFPNACNLQVRPSLTFHTYIKWRTYCFCFIYLVIFSVLGVKRDEDNLKTKIFFQTSKQIQGQYSCLYIQVVMNNLPREIISSVHKYVFANRLTKWCNTWVECGRYLFRISGTAWLHWH